MTYPAIAKYVPEFIPIYTSSEQLSGHVANQTVTSLFKRTCARLARRHW